MTLITPPHGSLKFSSERIIVGLTSVSFVVLSVWSMRAGGGTSYGAHLIEDAAIEHTIDRNSGEEFLAEVSGTRKGLLTEPARTITEKTRQAKALLERHFGKIKWQKAVIVPRMRVQ